MVVISFSYWSTLSMPNFTNAILVIFSQVFLVALLCGVTAAQLSQTRVTINSFETENIIQVQDEGNPGPEGVPIDLRGSHS